MAERRSPLAECLKPGVQGAVGPAGPGVEIRELRPLTVVQVAAFDADRAAAALAAALGVPAPSGPNGVASSGDSTVLWTGPGRWLVVEPESRDLASLLAHHCPGDVAAITDLSHARMALRVDGPQTRVLLAKLCTLDVDATAFPPGTCAQTQFGQIGVLLYCRAQNGFDIFMFRGFAVSAWESIVDAALEFGCRVT
ncbi:MAG TPA: sarcosine oxidase subunit gamma family protein [Stellaceae bacterium]|nr:sarcosine oxidase subunit gamma family protein [Stellaceae bacterium]